MCIRYGLPLRVRYGLPIVLNFISPAAWRIIVLVVAVFFTGWTVNGWRLDADHAETMRDKEKELSGLRLAVQDQNSKIDALRLRTEAATKISELAEASMKQTEKNAAYRVKRAEEIKPTTCLAMVESLKQVSR